MGLITGHLLFPSLLTGFLTQCTDPKASEKYNPVFFNEQEWKQLPKIIDIIIPATETKSASEVNAHLFLDQVFSLCMTPAQQEILKKGLTELLSKFTTTTNQKELLTAIDRKAYEGDETYAFFKVIKQYTLIGFFTSQEGITEASNYVKFPGDYKGEIPQKETTKNYGKTSLLYYI